jgi:hypothetical protein
LLGETKDNINEGANCVCVAQDGVQWWVGVPQNAGNFLTSWATTSILDN